MSKKTPAKSSKINLLIVDDSLFFRKSIKALLKEEPTLGLMWEAETAHEAIDVLAKQPTHVVLLDARLKNSDGLEVAAYVRAHRLTVKLIAITSYDDRANLLHLAKAGVHGILLKHITGPDEILEAIQRVMQGEKYFTPVAFQIIQENIDQLEYIPSLKLTEREKELLPLLANGLSAKEIGSRLQLETGTVEAYRKKLMFKTSTHTVQELVAFSFRNGLLSSKPGG